MISWSTLFHPLALDVLIIPVAIIAGLIIAWFTKKILIGLIITFMSLLLFDIWFWDYFYESGKYSESINVYSVSNFKTRFFFTAITFVIWSLLIKLKKEIKKEFE